jgi:HrpA-like RNA helicase
MRFDSQAQMSCLVECWVSQAAATQRKGRAGRVREGTCYRMITGKRWGTLPAQQTAEITRTSMDSLALSVRKLNVAPEGAGTVPYALYTAPCTNGAVQEGCSSSWDPWSLLPPPLRCRRPSDCWCS